MGFLGTKKVTERSVQDCIKIVEDFLNSVGLNPSVQRIDDPETLGWWASRGSALIYILLNDRDSFQSIRILSPILYLPEENILPFYRRCLELNMGLFNCAIGVSEDKVYIVTERPIVGLDPEEFEGTVNFLSATADDLDDKLADEFSARLYSADL